MSTILLLLLGILAILLIIAANGYFVAQEFAYMSVDRSRLRARAAEGDAQAERALGITKRTSFMLSGAQLGITVTGLLVGYVAEPLVGNSIDELLSNTGLTIAVGTVLALIVSTVVQMIFGELFPKNLAIANPEPLALRLAGSTRAYLAVFGWLITFFDRSANALLRLVRIEPVHDVDSSATARDLERIVADSRTSGDLPENLSLLLDRILDLPDHDVEHAMIPRSRVGVVRPEATIGEVRERMSREHTRYPVLDDEDQVVGLVAMAQVLDPRIDDTDAVSSIMREPLVVAALMPLPDALEQMTQAGAELACVIDEYGGFTGVLTMEDIAEELVGEITDEHDDAVPDEVTVEDEGQWLMSGEMHVDEAQRLIGHDLPQGDYETLSGLLIATHGDLPEPGDTIRVDVEDDPAAIVDRDRVRRHLDVEVLEVDRRVPSQLRARLVEEPVESVEEEQ